MAQFKQDKKMIGMHRYHFFTNRYVTDTFICVLADTEYQYQYFLDLVSMKEVQLIWRQFLFPPVLCCAVLCCSL